MSSESTVVKVSEGQRRRAVALGRRTFELDSLYSIMIFDLEEAVPLTVDQTPDQTNPDPFKRSNNLIYVFTVAPRSEEVEEPFATTITHTQNRGKFIESHGSIKKTVRISGTTGLRPNKPTIASNPDSVESPQFSVESEATGYDDIIFLRNLFRTYSDIKEDTNRASKTSMLWYNDKDGEYWIAEPLQFKVSRNSKASTLYDYAFTLELLSPYTSRIIFSGLGSLPVDPLQTALDPSRSFGDGEDLRKRALSNGRFLAVQSVTASQYLLRLQRYKALFQTKYLEPIYRVGRQVIGVRNQVINAPSQLLAAVNTAASDVLTFAQRIVATPEQLNDNLTASLRDTYNLRHSAYVSYRILKRIATIPFLRNIAISGVSSRFTRRSNAYNSLAASTGRAGPLNGQSFIGNQASAGGMNRGVVNVGETIRDLAARLTGSANAWRTIVTMNDLRPPYVAAERSPGVLAYGDVVLYPGTSGRTSGGVVTLDQTTAENSNLDTSPLSPNEIGYGRDLRAVIDDSEGTIDLDINQGGDISTIIGIPNVVQAMQLKFVTEVGELPAHPTYGARVSIGHKVTPQSLAMDRLNTVNTLLSDSRVVSVPSVRLASEGGTVSVECNILLTESSSPLSASFALRNT